MNWIRSLYSLFCLFFLLWIITYGYSSFFQRKRMIIQPIPFSHRIHAGTYQISCKHCHTTAEKSRHASIPALHICMGCHQNVLIDHPSIQKIKAAYTGGAPIEWVRIHQLPEFIYFTHQQHIQQGVTCAHCHGEVRSMDPIEQKFPLTMGWCIECHQGKTGFKKAPIDCSTCHQ